MPKAGFPGQLHVSEGVVPFVVSFMVRHRTSSLSIKF